MARLFVPLDVEFATDPKILEAGHIAAYLYIVSLAHCKRAGNDGDISRAQLAVLAVGLPGRAQRHADRLVEVGLWEATQTGWRITSWLKHNPSAATLKIQAEIAKENGQLGNHQRHHIDKGVVSPKCPYCVEEYSQTRSGGRSGGRGHGDGVPLAKGTKEGEVTTEGTKEGEGEGEGTPSSSSVELTLVATQPPEEDDPVSRILDAITHSRVAEQGKTGHRGYVRTVRADVERLRPGITAMLDERPDLADVEPATAACMFTRSPWEAKYA